MNIRIGFPTLGDMLKTLFGLTGCLPAKGGDGDTSKKTVQAKLRRLAGEDGVLEENLNELVEHLFDLVEEAIGNRRVALAAQDVIEEMLVTYRKFIQSEGTYLPTSESVRWLIKARVASKFIYRYRYSILMRNVGVASLDVPDGYWWLPDVDASGKVTWPLQKAYDWIYSVADTSKTRFHFPDCEPGAQTEPGHRRLENATRWSAGRVDDPSWISLSQNLRDSLQAMATTSRKEHRRVFDERIQESFRVVLFAARFSTAVFKLIRKQYGVDFVRALAKDLTRQDHRMKRLLTPMTKEISDYARKIGAPKQDWQDRFWHHQVTNHEAMLADQVRCAATPLVDSCGTGNACSMRSVRRHVATGGAFFVRAQIIEENYNVLRLCPPGFVDLLQVGLSLKNSATSVAEIDTFHLRVEQQHLLPHLEWLVHWVRAAYHYHRQEHAEALKYYEKAFLKAKYTAGESQYALVNQYIECCAKNDKRGLFNRGHAWARYLGIPCRWVRGSSSEEDMDFAYKTLSTVRYARL